MAIHTLYLLMVHMVQRLSIIVPFIGSTLTSLNRSILESKAFEGDELINYVKGAVMQIEKTMINDSLRVLKVS